MDSILQQITDWLKEMLVSAIMGNLSGMFESVNNQVGEIATSVGMTPANFSPGVFAMVRNISESVIIPIAGLILTFIACYELIQMIIDHNNLANFETWIFFKWVFKTFVAVMLITNTFNITMAVFDVTQHVIKDSQPLEVVVEHFIQTKFVRPKVRPYQTDNYYDALMRQYKLEKEVERIVFQKEATGKKHQNACKSESEAAARN